MKAVIMAAGEGRRMGELTKSIPKPMLPIGNTPLLDIKLSQLEGIVDEAIIVVGYLKERFLEYYRSHFTAKDGTLQYQQEGWNEGISLKFVEQDISKKGTAKALECCAEHLVDEEFLVMNCDNFYGRNAIEKVIQSGVNSIAVTEIIPGLPPKPLAETRNGRLIAIHEKIPLLASIGIYYLNYFIFPHLAVVKESPRGEYEITDALTSLARSTEVRTVLVSDYIEITNPRDLAKAEVLLRERGILQNRRTP